MRTLVKLSWVELKLFAREPITVIFTLALPVIFVWRSKRAERVGKRGAARMDAELPGMLKKCGFRRDADFSTTDLGLFEGKYEGYRMEIEPERTRTFKVRLRRKLPCFLSNEKPYCEPREGMHEFDFSDPQMNRFFRIRHAAPTS